MAGPIHIQAGRTNSLTSAVIAGGGIVVGPSPSQYNKSQDGQIITQPSSTVSGKTPPSFPASADLVEGTGTRSFSAVTTQAGDYIVIQTGVEADVVTTSDLTPSVSGLTFTIQNDSGTASNGGKSRVTQWTALDSTGGSRTITITPGGGSLNYRARLTVVRGSDGPGGKNVNVNTQTVSVTRQSPNSAVFMNLDDWSTGAVGTPVWTPGGSTVASQQGTGATYIFGRWDDSGSVGTANHGISTPTYTTPSIAVLEMQGTASGGATTVNGDSALSGLSTLVASSVVTESATSALSGTSTLTVAGSVTAFGISALSGTSTLTAAGTTILLGTSALSALSTLTASGTVTSAGASANLSGLSTLTVSGLVTELPSSTLSGLATLNAAGTISKLGSAGLSGSATLTVSAISVELPSVSLSGSATLTAAGSIGANNSSNMNAQSTLTVASVVITNPTAPLTSQSSLVTNSLVTKLPSVGLSGQSNMVTGSTGTVAGSIAANSQLTLSVSAFVGTLPVTVNLTGFTQLTVAGAVSKFANSALSAQSNFSINPTVIATGTSAMSAQSNNTVSALVTVISGTVNPTALSVLTVSAQRIASATTGLNGQSTLTVSGKVATNAIASLTAALNLNTVPVVSEFVTVQMTAQSNLNASGFVPVVYFGTAQFGAIASLVADANSTPPWVFPYIEFSSVKTTSHSGQSSVTTSREGGSSRGTNNEGSGSVVSIEGG